MKIMLCEHCYNLVVPSNTEKEVKWCSCRQSAVWWKNPETGELGIYGSESDKISVIGLHNRLLTAECSPLVTTTKIKEIIESTKESYLFKSQETLVIRVRAGITNDIELITEKDKVPH